MSVEPTGYRMIVEYEGTAYSGFQYQEGSPSIQGELESALQSIGYSGSRVAGAGRTDAGVHAIGQVISFDGVLSMPIERIAVAMNSRLPRDISVSGVELAERGFHARYSATSRRYVYAVLNRPERSAVMDRFSWHVFEPLDVEAMRRGASHLIGAHDFRAWANGSTDGQRTVRDLSRCRIRTRGSLILIQVHANAFLRGMVRNIVGTLVEVGMGRRLPEDVIAITQSLDRRLGGRTAPARGLCLVKVSYDGPRVGSYDRPLNVDMW